MSGFGTRPTAAPIPVDANRQALAQALLGLPARVGQGFVNMANTGLAANEAFLQGEGADRPFLPSMDNGGRIGALASFLNSNMALGGPAGSLGAGISTEGRASTAANVAARAASALPMDEASRMARARELGFTDDVLHGTGRDFTAFQRGAPETTLGSSNQAAVYVTRTPEVANAYAGEIGAASPWRKNVENWAPQVMPLRIADANPLVLNSDDYFALKRLSAGTDKDGQGAAVWRKLFNEAPPSGDAFEALQKRGFTSVHDNSGKYGEIAVFDPRNIRSRFAAFDPARRNEADLLASYGPNPLSAALMGAQPQE